ncbi:lipopolysaccharide biosynthesis protein [Polaromonas sp. UC242_47]|uniref:lipopolysaccharide biosynthesis protein n=1 Tax=Polaromonas sp. UC242_47 TaxID=3374626 RepID=UPI00378B2541
MTLRSQVLAGLKWTVLGRLTSQLLTWAITIYVIRLLKPEDYGLMALAAIFSALFSLLSEMGLGSTLVQTKDLPPQRLRQIFGLVVLSNGAACLVMATVVAPLVALFFAEPRLQPVVQVIALQFIPAMFVVVPSAMLERNMKYRGRAITDLVSTTGGALVTLLLANMGYGVFALAWGIVFGTIVRAVGLNIASPFLGRPIFHFAGCGSMFDFGRNVAATQLVWFLYSQADAFIVGKFLGKHNLGVYSVSMDLASLPASRVSSILNQLVFPSLSKVKRDGGTVGPYLLKGMRSLSLVSFPVMWGMSSVAPELVRTLLGEKWVEAALPLTLLCLIMPMRVLSPLMHAGLYAVGRADVSFRITAITAATMCSAFLVGAQYGLIGLSLAWLVAFPGAFLFNLLRSCKHLGLTVKEIATTLARPALASCLMYVLVILARHAIGWPSAIANLLTLTAVGAVAYTGFTFMFNREVVLEIRNLITRSPST